MTGHGVSRFVSVEDFSARTGLSCQQVKSLYTVKVNGVAMVPRFLIDSDPEEVSGIAAMVPEVMPVVLADKVKVKGLDPFERVSNRARLARSHIEANAFPRFLARLLDLMLFTAPVLLGYSFLLELYSTTNRPLALVAQFVIGWILCSLVAMLLEACWYGLTGNTPGKSLLKLKLSYSTGERLRFWSYLQRNIAVFIQGLAFMLMPLTLIAMWIQFRRVNDQEASSYDAGNGFMVSDDSPGALRRLVFMVTLALATFLAILGTVQLYYTTVGPLVIPDLLSRFLPD